MVEVEGMNPMPSMQTLALAPELCECQDSNSNSKGTADASRHALDIY
jgi:hypothetical protein